LCALIGGEELKAQTLPTSTISLSGNPFSVMVNPATNKIYVASYNSSNVKVINGLTNDREPASQHCRKRSDQQDLRCRRVLQPA
jgi:DNA-binding beta-propeller fold protein YncE